MSANNEQGHITVSVVVPVWNGASTLGACLQALGNQTFDPASFEVIVVDDGSQDNSAEVATRCGARLYQQQHAGAAAARNLGAQHAQGNLLLFTDADCEPFPDWMERMVQPFSDPQVAGVKGSYHTRQRALVARFTQAEYMEKYAHMRRQNRIDFVDTYAAAYRRCIFLEQGGFDPTFLLDEDQEFSFRLSQAGFRLVFAPEAWVYHRHPDNTWRYARRKVGIGTWKVRVHLRHPQKAFRDSYTPWTQKAQLLLFPILFAAGAAAVAGWIPWFPFQILFALGLLISLPLMAQAARQGAGVLIISPALIVLRALALDTGLIVGFWKLLCSRKGKNN